MKHKLLSSDKLISLSKARAYNDTQIKTKAGDVMLYQGNQISIFYGSNSWSYTKLGEITNKTENELKDVLGNSSTTLVLSIN